MRIEIKILEFGGRTKRGNWVVGSKMMFLKFPKLARVPASNVLYAGTVPASNFLYAGTVPASNCYLILFIFFVFSPANK